MRKARWMLPLIAVSILILLGTSACGNAEGVSEDTVILSPIQRIQNLESSLIDRTQDYISILDKVDQAREELDILATQIDGMDNFGNFTCPVTEEMYEGATSNITVLQEIISFLEDVVSSLGERIGILEVTCNVSGNSS